MSALRSIYGGLLSLGLLLSLASYAVSLAIAGWAFFVDPKGMEAATKLYYGILIFYFLFLSWEFPISFTAGSLVVFLEVAYITCFAASFFSGERLDRVVRDLFEGRLERGFRNWLLAMPILFGMLLSVLIAFAFLQQILGVDTGSIQFSDQYSSFVSLSYAPIAEEIGFRIIPLGLSLIVSTAILRRKRFVKSNALIRAWPLAFLNPLLFKKKTGTVSIDRRRKGGLSRAINRIDWIMILITSASFGLAHYISGIGWSAGKVTQTSISGIIMGAVYYLYGAPAPILIHWLFDFYISAYLQLNAPMALILLPTASMILAGFLGWIGATAYAIDRISVRRRGG